jgi:hypothetical protein
MFRLIARVICVLLVTCVLNVGPIEPTQANPPVTTATIRDGYDYDFSVYNNAGNPLQFAFVEVYLYDSTGNWVGYDNGWTDSTGYINFPGFISLDSVYGIIIGDVQLPGYQAYNNILTTNLNEMIEEVGYAWDFANLTPVRNDG